MQSLHVTHLLTLGRGYSFTHAFGKPFQLCFGHFHGHSLRQIPLDVLQIRVPRGLGDIAQFDHVEKRSHFVLDAMFVVDEDGFEERFPQPVRPFFALGDVDGNAQLLGHGLKEPDVRLKHGRLVGADFDVDLRDERPDSCGFNSIRILEETLLLYLRK